MSEKDLILIGVDYKQTAFASLEGLSVSKEKLSVVLQEMKRWAALEEVVILSTCSRVEVMGRARNPNHSILLIKNWFMSRAGRLSPADLRVYQGEKAVNHLFRIGAGLDSWIVGEAEILRQVKEAYLVSLEAGTTGSSLNRIFQTALSVGKNARTKTGIQNGISSIGGAAALLARKFFGERETGTLVVFGAGQTAEAVARHMVAKNVKNIYVANRTLENAERVAVPLGGKAVSLEEGRNLLRTADAAVYSIACSEPVLTLSQVRTLMKGRASTLFLVDLGMPRNIDPDCSWAAKNVHLYNLENLKQMVRENMRNKSVSIEKAEKLVAGLTDDCMVEIRKSFQYAQIKDRRVPITPVREKWEEAVRGVQETVLSSFC